MQSLLTSELFDRLKGDVESTLLHLLTTNANTRYVRESPVFTNFRTALDANDRPLIQSFRDTVPLTAYDAYEPFVNRMLDPTLRENDVKDMFAPGLPAFIASSSATSGKKCKLYAKYCHAQKTSTKDVDEHANPVSAQGGKNCVVYSLTYHRVIDVINDDETRVAQFPLTSMSAGVIRMEHGITVDKDPWLITCIAPRATSPIAVSFIANYRSFLLMHVLFALADPDLENISTLFGTVFIDMIRYMEEEWDTLVQSIDTGVLPNWEGTSHVRCYLEPKFPERPQRAAHLRAVGKAKEQPGWLKRLWPRLNVVIGIASGVFAGVIPKMQHYLGPDVHMTSLGFTASEAYVGTAYSHTDLNLFKTTNDDIIEYLDISAAETASNLAFAHEVKVGHRYEIVVTTRDGLWRYRLGDVVEIAGFDPIDGSPIIRYVERRGAFLRLTSGMISEEQLKTAIFSAQDKLGPITEFTVIVDERQMPPSLAYLVEIDGELTPSAHQAPACIEADLSDANENVVGMLEKGKLGPLAVYILKPGTFREFRSNKVKATITGTGIGQIKVPVVLWDPEMQEWMLGRVHKAISRTSVSC